MPQRSFFELFPGESKRKDIVLPDWYFGAVGEYTINAKVLVEPTDEVGPKVQLEVSGLVELALSTSDEFYNQASSISI